MNFVTAAVRRPSQLLLLLLLLLLRDVFIVSKAPRMMDV